jgi:hypothetical protein
MRMMMKVCFPTESGNRGIKDGSFPRTVMAFIEQHKPEAAYFIAERGMRTGIFFVDLKDPTMIPTLAEPFFMNLGAEIELVPCMNAQEMKQGVERAMKGA